MDINDIILRKVDAESRVYEILALLEYEIKLSVGEVILGHVRTGLDNKKLTSVKLNLEL